ncbi:aspartate/glutamate racemase family protein [Verminephrobacter eiseniae]|uniref:Asp/Glu racemase n=1 Tax=Verminephrobacter eiseniae (strain EF01-2) TaxID=391735 RepID=A1WKQ6_VEREI|nr:aspartate/glutamate racemase family protein [Verminephrobacter eiseniae]ABM58213.1 Asp/Glu racemase [Verminephrobacter eiseniae EF01-2]MCW5283809.1 Asp/Glu racemase [Verminephrobacter eiseniae]MCW5301518.1 Asp/Glu racemase [Verminephrobacter eiseniae]MCW8182457.1 Asp/Glu racemase [Verminephrobacter eiseniae]MCW8192977.1 Asp/Glu racemase [Verminephrobacter eiseniae]
MRQLLVINPNTSAHVSALLQQHVQAAAGLHVAVRTVTARFGAPYIACEASYAVAAHAALDAWAHDLAQSRPRPDAVLIGCFGDPGLMALRESSPVPVTGLAEASFVEAARHGRYAIVTGGQRWGPMLQRLAQALGQTQALAGIHTVTATGAQLAADPVAAHALLAPACRDAVRQLGVQAVILGGAGMAGMAAAVQSQLAMLGVSGVPVIDSVLAGAHWALHAHPAPAQRQTPGFDVAWTGLSQEMALLGA